MTHLGTKYFRKPSYGAKISCSIDISEECISYGELLYSNGFLLPGRLGKVSLPSGVVIAGKIENPEKLTEVLKILANKLDLKNVRISLSEEQMYLFTLSLPSVIKENEIMGAISLQLEDRIPLKSDKTTFNYEIIYKDKESFVVDVLAIDSGILDTYISVFRKAHLKALSFGLNSALISRAVIPYDDTSRVMIVNLEDNRALISIVENHRLRFTKTMHIRPISLDTLPSFVAELKNYDQYCRLNGYEDEEVRRLDHIIVCGSGSNLPNLAKYVSSMIGVPTKIANVWVNILDLDKIIPEISFIDSLSYASVIGLSLLDYLSDSKFVINIVHQE